MERRPYALSITLELILLFYDTSDLKYIQNQGVNIHENDHSSFLSIFGSSKILHGFDVFHGNQIGGANACRHNINVGRFLHNVTNG